MENNIDEVIKKRKGVIWREDSGREKARKSKEIQGGE